MSLRLNGSSIRANSFDIANAEPDPTFQEMRRASIIDAYDGARSCA